MSKKILIISDAYPPQTNGVVTAITNLVEQLKDNHHKVWVYHPSRTKFLEYIQSKLKIIPAFVGWYVMKNIYNTAHHILTTTSSMKKELVSHGVSTSISI